MQKLTAIFTTPSGLALVATFLIAGLTAVQTNFTGNVAADIGLIISILGLLAHPTNMVAGRSVSK